MVFGYVFIVSFGLKEREGTGGYLRRGRLRGAGGGVGFFPASSFHSFIWVQTKQISSYVKTGTYVKEIYNRSREETISYSCLNDYTQRKSDQTPKRKNKERRGNP